MNHNPFHFEAGLQLGDYVLGTLVIRHNDREIWTGKQLSVKREVEIVCYHGEQTEQFLTDARTKAGIQDGTFGLVYEAIEFEGFITLIREVLPRDTLARRIQMHKSMSPLAIAQLLSTVSSSLDSLSVRDIAFETLTPEGIHFDPQSRVRLRNVAQAGQPTSDTATRKELAAALRPMLTIGIPGATRMGTLLDYLEGTELKTAISWPEVHRLSSHVVDQLTEAEVPIIRSQPMVANEKTGSWVITAALVLGALMMAVGFWAINLESTQVQDDLSVVVPSARYPRPNGGIVELSNFRIDADEVTIGEYAKFLEAWNEMGEDERQHVFPSGIPEDKRDPQPDNWTALYNAARGENELEGRQMSLDCPVVGVDWWEAMAYGEWMGGTLPTEQQWWAAVTFAGASAKKLEDWGPVLGLEGKISGLGGKVAEWALNSSKDPSFPMNGAKPVVLGRSYANEATTALSREWVDSHALSRPDLGFRVVYPVEQ